MDNLLFEEQTIPAPIEETVQPEAEKKRGRGRPKKSDAASSQNTPENPAKPKEKKPKVDIFEELKAASEQVKRGENLGQNPSGPIVNEEAKKWVNGYVLLIVADAVIPMLIVAIMKKRGKAITKTQIRMTPAERKDMSPLADAAAAEILPHVNPLAAFFIGMAGIYLSKIPD